MTNRMLSLWPSSKRMHPFAPTLNIIKALGNDHLALLNASMIIHTHTQANQLIEAHAFLLLKKNVKQQQIWINGTERIHKLNHWKQSSQLTLNIYTPF